MVPFLTDMSIYLYESLNKGSKVDEHTQMKKKLGPRDHPRWIILYPITSYVAGMVSPGGVVVITPD